MMSKLPDDNLKKVFAYFDFENSQSKISRTPLQTRLADTGLCGNVCLFLKRMCFLLYYET